MKTYYVYILASINKNLYIGVTNNLERRIQEHKRETIKGFTSRYKINKLVYYQSFSNVTEAIDWEKKLKSWKRIWKIELIEKENTYWKDLALEFSNLEKDAESSSAWQ